MKTILKWTARVLVILYILFIGMFSLDVFGGAQGFWETLTGFLIHNIPAFLLIGMLCVAWKYPRVGGIGFLLCGLAMMFFVRLPNIWGKLLFSSPLWVAGILFLWSGRPKRS